MKNNVKTRVKHLSVFVKELNNEYQSSPLRKPSEECATQLHHYPPHEIDKGMFCLFVNKKIMNQMIWSKLTRQIHEFQWIYLRDKCLLEIVKSFSNDYQARKGKLAILKEIMRAIIQRAIEEYNWLIFGINV
ncbi:hypothetical protein Glove_71g151 [Diversispora epigaea]|uniref:Uncharacterized protein n=1 Tax=Diversispora epigaea TaxID=1348612 RepID=A0A397JGQ5_9GLOM|nr:hypothetical protein Glove_71g151 [Diversispora epigaea]